MRADMLRDVPVRLELVIQCCLPRHIECFLVLHCDIDLQVVMINLLHASPATRALATIDQQTERACYDSTDPAMKDRIPGPLNTPPVLVANSVRFWPASVRQPLRGVTAETLRDSRDPPRP